MRPGLTALSSHLVKVRFNHQTCSDLEDGSSVVRRKAALWGGTGKPNHVVLSTIFSARSMSSGSVAK